MNDLLNLLNEIGTVFECCNGNGSNIVARQNEDSKVFITRANEHLSALEDMGADYGFRVVSHLEDCKEPASFTDMLEGSDSVGDIKEVSSTQPRIWLGQQSSSGAADFIATLDPA